jgi:adenylosuccinate synthase
MDKTGRNGLRVGDILSTDFRKKYDALKKKHEQLLQNFSFDEDISADENEFFQSIEFLRTLKIVNGEYFINDLLQSGKNVLAEGAQGSMLDVDFGTFPFVTSSNTITAGVCSGLGIAPQKIKEVIGITKAYCTRVGSGPFPTELHDETGELIRQNGHEFGSTTGRPRRCGWMDLVALNFACMINGVTQLVMTKADVLDSLANLKLCNNYLVNGQETSQVPFQMEGASITPLYKEFPGWNIDITRIKDFKNLPSQMGTYIDYINSILGIPVKYISNGPGTDQIIVAL